MTARASLSRSRAPRRRRRGGTARASLGAARLLGLLLLAALAVRCLVVMPRAIPSESMRPGLVPGDYVLVEKWPYGWSRFSLPIAPPGPHGRLFGRAPARGDVVVFHAPGGRFDFIKRVIGLPGDTVAMAGGRLILNGRAVPLDRIADAVAPAGRGCRSIAPPPYGPAHGFCRLPAFVETLPGGRTYRIIDQGRTMQDDMAPVTVPPGHYFMLGDNRDLSEDSRFPVAAGGIGMVPAEDLEGRAGVVALSLGRGLRGLLPWAAR